jgi:hypothetical protein
MKTENNKPVDIINMASGRYRIGLDEACESTSINKADPWDLVIKCVNGEIYPFSNRLLAFHCAKRIIRNRLNKDCPKIAVRNWSDNGEAIFLFEQRDFDLVKKYAAPRKIRKLSENRKADFVKSGSEALIDYRKSKANSQNLTQIQEIIP